MPIHDLVRTTRRSVCCPARSQNYVLTRCGRSHTQVRSDSRFSTRTAVPVLWTQHTDFEPSRLCLIVWLPGIVKFDDHEIYCPLIRKMIGKIICLFHLLLTVDTCFLKLANENFKIYLWFLTCWIWVSTTKVATLWIEILYHLFYIIIVNHWD